MKNLIGSRFTSLLFFVLLAFLTGSCSTSVIPTLPPTSSPASATSTPYPIATSLPKLSPEMPTDTPTPSPIPPTRTPRPTPAPTMTADEEYAFVSEMLRDNGGCRLPCWWGFTPGETASQIVETFFLSLGKQVWNYGDPQDYTIIYDIPEHYSHGQYYVAQEDTIEMIQVSASPPVGEDGDFAFGDLQFANDWQSFMLPQILENYGQPQQVWLETYSSDLPDWIPYRLLLFYPDQGILVQYEGPIGEGGKTYGPIEEGKSIRICPWQSGIALWLWSPEREMTFKDLGPAVESAVHLDRLRSLEEAAGMSIEQFYQIFVELENEACLETPADLW